jgi:hypothetical protein
MFTDSIVSQLVKWKLTESFMFPGLFTDGITSSVGSLKCRFQQICLFWRWEELDFGGQFHTIHYTTVFNILKGGALSSPHSKWGVSSANFL